MGKEGCNKMSPQRVAGRPTLLSVLITTGCLTG